MALSGLTPSRKRSIAAQIVARRHGGSGHP
jgi:hypothetical protein